MQRAIIHRKRFACVLSSSNAQRDLHANLRAHRESPIMDDIGVFSAIGLSIKVLSICIQYSQDVKDAMANIQRLCNSVTNLQSALKSMQTLLDGPQGARLRETAEMFDAIKNGKSLLQKLEEELAPDKHQKKFSFMSRRALTWPFQSKKVMKIMREIDQCRDVMATVLQIDQTKILLDLDQKVVLDRLPVAEGASFDSYFEEHNPRCLPDTRVDILKDIVSWAEDESPDSHAIFWLNGMAGTGKSTISRTVAESLATRNRLGSSFFFKRGETDRGGLSKFFTTIAYDLAVRQPLLTTHVKNAVDGEPTIITKSMREQFNRLILGPLSKLQPPLDTASLFGVAPKTPAGSAKKGLIEAPVIIVIDALDECEKDSDVKQLISLFSQSKQLKSPRLKAFITSRPELPIRLGFTAIKGKYQDFILQSIPAPIIKHDISLFLHHELAKILSEYNGSVTEDRRLPIPWPSDDKVQTLVKMAVPLFIYASTMCLFINDRKFGNPQKRLDMILSYQTKSQEAKLDATYMPVLEQLLVGLSTQEKAELINQFKRIVGSIVILFNPLSAAALSAILQLDQSDIDVQLDMLHSVLNVPASAVRPVRLLHLSFRDFLLDSNKRETNPFWIDEKIAQTRMFENCLRLLGTLKSNMCDLQAPDASRSTVDPAKIDSALPPELQYACLYWVSHLEEAGNFPLYQDRVRQLLLVHFLHWLEALSLMGRSADGIRMIQVLLSLSEPDSELYPLLKDAKRFATGTNASVIESWPLQIYSAALVFTPRESQIRAAFESLIPPWLSLASKVHKTWNPSLVETLLTYGPNMQVVVFSRDSTQLAAVNFLLDSRIWLTDTGEYSQNINVASNGYGYDNMPRSMAISNDLELAANSLSNGKVCIWRLKTGDPLHFFPSHDQAVNSLAFSHDSTMIVSGGKGTAVYVTNFRTGEILHKFTGHEKEILYVAFSHDSRLVVSASKDKNARIWNLETGACMHNLVHGSVVKSASFSHDSKLVVSTSDDAVIRLWQVESGQCFREIKDRVAGLHFAVISPNSQLIASLSDDAAIRLWSATTGCHLEELKGHNGFVDWVAFSHDSTRIASTANDRTVRIWSVSCERNTESQKAIDISGNEVHTGYVSCVVPSPNVIFTASMAVHDKVVRIWGTDTGQCVQKLDHDDDLDCDVRLAFSPDSSILASATYGGTEGKLANGTLHLWQTGTGQRLHECKCSARINGVAFSPNSEFIAAMVGRAVQIWRVDTGNCISALKGHRDKVVSVTFSPNSTLVASNSKDCTAILWDIKTGACIHELIGHSSLIMRGTFSHDSTLFATASGGRSIRIWSVETGECLHVLEKDKREYILSWTSLLGFSPDGSVLVSILSSEACALRIWSTETGESIREIGMANPVNGKESLQSHLEFGAEKLRIITEHRLIDVDSSHFTDINSATTASQVGYGIRAQSTFGAGKDEHWITWSGSNVLRLPVEYLPNCSAVMGSTVAIGCKSGRVVFFHFPSEHTPGI